MIRVQYGTMSTAIKHLRVVDRDAKNEPDDYFHRDCAPSVAIRQRATPVVAV